MRRKPKAPPPARDTPRVDRLPAPTVRGVNEEAIDTILRWRREPWAFVREALKATPDPWQDEILHALPTNFMIALKACKGPGKTCVLAWIIIWFMVCFDDAKVLCTSITGENLKDNLWAELSLWIGRSEVASKVLVWQSERIFMRERPETWFVSARSWPKDADKTKQANTLAGLHAKNSMVVLDESGDIPEGVLTAGLAHHSTQDPKVKEYHYTLQAGNPTTTDGALGFACTRDRERWWVKEITGDPDDPLRAPRIDIEWARNQIKLFGKDHAWVLVNVFGQFPPVSSAKLLGEPIIRKAMRATFPEKVWKTAPRIMGLDVARSMEQDRSSLCRRQGKIVFPFRIWRIDDLMTLCSQVAFEFSNWPADVIIVDMTGLGGGVVDRLRQLGLPVLGVHFGQKPVDERFADKRTEIWWRMSQAIKGVTGEPGLALPTLDELIPELMAPSLEFDRRGKVRLTSKDVLRKQGLPSPDIADSLALTFAESLGTDLVKPAHTPSGVSARVAQDYDPYGSDPDYDPYKQEV